jgi:hypothetical protein
MSFLKVLFGKLLGTDPKPETQKSQNPPVKVAHEKGGSSCCGGCGGGSKDEQDQKTKPE